MIPSRNAKPRRPAAPKPKRCARSKGGCGGQFVPARPLQTACGWSCAQEMARAKREQDEARRLREERAKDRAAREEMKPLRRIVADTQAACNAMIRARDAGLPCVSCGTTTAGQWHAGHYLSTGARPELRFEPLNIWRQCAQCNLFLSGNLVLFRAELVRRIGREKVDWLEGPHPVLKLSAARLREMAAQFRAETRRLTKGNP